MLGVACSAHELWLTSGMVEQHTGPSSTGPSASYVYNSNQWYFDMYAAPYVVSTYAYFVPNPLGVPAYYLKLDQTITNIDPSEAVNFTIDASAFASAGHASTKSYPTTCTGGNASPCTAGATTVLMGGAYTTAGATDGLAVAAFPSAAWASGTKVDSKLDVNVDSTSIKLRDFSWTISPQSSRTHSVFVMVGSWANAQNYALRQCTFSVSRPFPVAMRFIPPSSVREARAAALLLRRLLVVGGIHSSNHQVLALLRLAARRASATARVPSRSLFHRTPRRLYGPVTS